MKHKLTQQDVDKMKAEIEHRKVEVRPELLEHVKEARAHGDLSENFEYHAAKKEKNRNESRIRYLERMIRTCEIVEDHSNADQVGLNKTVSPTGNPRDIQFVVMVGGSALDFEIPNFVTDALADYEIVAGRGNIRGCEGPRNAVATGLAMACVEQEN